MGRRSLLAEARTHLASSRIVTLVGPGGVGKTRVAVRLAEVERRGYRDGCWVVPLAEVPKPQLLGPGIAEAMGLQAVDRPWDVETLADYLADRTALLVLDNCEHLVSAVGDLVERLRVLCPNVTFLLTSRRPLGLSGEDVLVVPPLGVPDDVTVAAPEAITHYEAVTLFLDRARSARADFQMTPGNARSIAGLCRDLDGMPLAIELAAARVRVMSPQEIRDSLAERFRLLNVGYRDSDQRHQSLGACVEWSYQLCTATEQSFWARSSVFAGGFDLGAAVAVCGADDLPPGDVLDLVSGLVDQSVLVVDTTELGRTRYRMLTDIREFGLERAEKDGELRGMRDRHASWCAELVSQFHAEAGGPDQPDWLRLLRAEDGNLRAALGHLAGSVEGAASGLAVARRLALYWSAGGLLDEGRHWLELALATDAGAPGERALAMAVAARFAALQHDRVRARELVEQGTRAATAVEGTPALALLLVPAAMLDVWDGYPAAAADRADTAVALLPEPSDLPDLLLALFVAGVCHGFAGNGAEAAARHRRCIARADEVGERHMKALAVAGLGEQELGAGRLPGAAALFREAIVLKRELGDRIGIAVGLDSLGRVAIAEDRGERAALLLGAAARIWDAAGMSETGNPFAFTPSRSEGVQQVRRLLGKARFRELFRRGAQLRLEEAVAYALEADAVDPPPPAAPEPSPLTRRELEVADLVADGLSNPEIAARLVISVRTAQGHVENILRKLGFSSRSRIAAWVTERRLSAGTPALDGPHPPPGTIAAT